MKKLPNVIISVFVVFLTDAVFSADFAKIGNPSYIYIIASEITRSENTEADYIKIQKIIDKEIKNGSHCIITGESEKNNIFYIEKKQGNFYVVKHYSTAGDPLRESTNYNAEGIYLHFANKGGKIYIVDEQTKKTNSTKTDNKKKCITM
jgi:hypothetical protein